MAATGIEDISSSTVLLQLCGAAMDWIRSTWDKDESEIRIQISPKEIGRQKGFIVDVSTSNPDIAVRYFAKAQEMDMSYETVLVHHMLRLMKCGPDTFSFPVLDGPDGIKLGVITAEVDGFTMASALTEADQDKILFHEDDCLTSSFLLTFLVQLGRFSNIPNNMDNWGYVPEENASIVYPHLALVDFSSCGDDPGFFLAHDAFQEGWLNCIDKIACAWNVTDDAAWREQRTKLLSKLVVEEQIRHFPFFQSRQALTELLQTAVNQTALWLQEVVENSRQANAENIHTNIMPSTTDADTTETPINTSYNNNNAKNHNSNTTGTATPPCTPTTTITSPLIPFQHIPCPDTVGLGQGCINMIDFHCVLVRDLNTDLTALFEWFPFPSGGGCISSNITTDAAIADVTTPDIQEERTSSPSVQTTGAVDCSTTYAINNYALRSIIGSGMKRGHSQLDTASTNDV